MAGFSMRTIGSNGSYKPPYAHRSKNPQRHRDGRVTRTVRAALAWIMKVRTRREKKILILKIIGICAGLGVLYFAILWFTLPNIDDPRTLFASQSTVIVDRNNVELYRVFSDQDRTYVPLSKISDAAEHATVAIEDERFQERGCFDIIGFARAALSQVLPSILVRSGGSTLTQQFAKNALVGNHRTLTRKVRELMLACELESKFDKQKLLELYLNWIPYGENAYGIEQASHRYFGTSADKLTLPQAAVLAALVQRPSYFSPYGSHVHTIVSEDVTKKILDGMISEARDISDDDVTIGLLGADAGTGAFTVYVGGRTDEVLKKMMDQGFITEKERTDAVIALKTIVFTRTRDDIRAPHFVLNVRNEVTNLVPGGADVLEQGGFTIVTTLDWKLQEQAEKIVKAHAEDLLKRFEANNAALVSVDPKTREILAYVGNIDYHDEAHEGKIDMASVPRQPGSSFKPFVYAKAFEQGYGPGTVIYDVSTKIGDDEPQNYDGTFLGLMTMRTALAFSRNIPAAKTFFLAGGEDAILSLVESMGVKTPTTFKAQVKLKNPDFEYGWPLAIGAAEAPLTEMVQGFATFADGGRYRPPVMILKITDRQGNILYQHKEENDTQVLDPRIAAEITSILSDPNARPPNEFWRAQLSLPVAAAAKTGTSNKCLERNQTGSCTSRRPESNWTMGYTSNLVTGVWVGNATSASLAQKADGLSTAAPIWHEFMTKAIALHPGAGPFPLPDGIAQPQISLLSGKLPTECTPVPLRRSDLFLEENIPTEEDPACQMLKVDKVTGLLASASCPADAVEEHAFFVPSSELPKRFPSWEQSVQEWAKRQMDLWNATEDHSGSLLPLPLAPTEQCDVAKTPGRAEKPMLHILAPSANAAVSYPAFDVELQVQSTAAIKEIRFAIDGKTVRTVENIANTTIPIRVPRSVDRNGPHTLTVTLVNEYFTEASASTAFTFEP